MSYKYLLTPLSNVLRLILSEHIHHWMVYISDQRQSMHVHVYNYKSKMIVQCIYLHYVVCVMYVGMFVTCGLCGVCGVCGVDSNVNLQVITYGLLY